MLRAVGPESFQTRMSPILDRVPDIFDAVVFEQGEHDTVKMRFTRGSHQFSLELSGPVDPSSVDLYAPKADYALCRQSGTAYPTPAPVPV